MSGPSTLRKLQSALSVMLMVWRGTEATDILRHGLVADTALLLYGRAHVMVLQRASRYRDVALQSRPSMTRLHPDVDAMHGAEESEPRR